MFGYVRADTPYLFIKDDTLYKAMYCGLCKGIGACCGQAARMGLSYDVTFLSVILHNIAGQDVTIEKSHCLTHCIRGRKMAQVDEMSKQLGAFNTALVYYKYTDDIADGDKGQGKRLWFAAGHKRGKKAYPEIEKIVRESMAAQQQAEESKTDSLDRAADASACMVARVCDYILGEKRTDYTYKLFYSVGKWIYLIDAFDDYDKDIKKGAYNPFRLAYNAGGRCELIEKFGKEITFVFHSLFYDIRECLANIKFHFNRDLSDNILLRGLPMVTKNIMEGVSCAKASKRGVSSINK